MKQMIELNSIGKCNIKIGFMNLDEKLDGLQDDELMDNSIKLKKIEIVSTDIYKVSNYI
jgi:hypothetical protein